jgi:hypothetical protein
VQQLHQRRADPLVAQTALARGLASGQGRNAALVEGVNGIANGAVGKPESLLDLGNALAVGGEKHNASAAKGDRVESIIAVLH